MRTIVRVLPRLVVLGAAGGALLVLAQRAQDANAQVPDPPAVPSVPAPDLPPVGAPPVPELPPVPAPTLPPAPDLPPAPAVPPSLPLPAPPVPTVPAVPAPELPGIPSPALPDAPGTPAPPAVPGFDPGDVTGAVAPLPEVPAVSPPDASLAELPEPPDLPELPDPAAPLDGVLELTAAPIPAPPGRADSPARAPSTPVADPAPSRAGITGTGTDGAIGGVDVGFAPARAPPTEVPGSPHPCPGGGSTQPTRADPAAFLPPGADAASRRAGLLAEARAYASALIRDPLLRPD
ncbi:MAG TPA: hypothetical protein VKB11_01840 [Acidimicrobiia bacterium]|nr:hypothetical protein [Acidimicrobiia bacterium]